MGLDPETPGSGPEPKAGAKPLSQPGIPLFFFLNLFYLFLKDFIYLFIRQRERERERERRSETQAEGEAGSMQAARRGTRSGVSRITPWAEGRR